MAFEYTVLFYSGLSTDFILLRALMLSYMEGTITYFCILIGLVKLNGLTFALGMLIITYDMPSAALELALVPVL